MADKYQRIEKPQEQLPSNEIRVKRGVGIGRYLKRAYELLNGTTGTGVGGTPGEPTGPTADHIIIKGVSNAVETAVKLAELIKHRIKGLHQINKINHITIVDEYEPLEEGLDHLKFTRIVTMLEILLSKNPLDTNDVGYQAPIDESEVQEYSERQDDGQGEDGRRRRNRRYNRRRRGGGQGQGNDDQDHKGGRGGGPKRGGDDQQKRSRNRRQRGRGGRGGDGAQEETKDGGQGMRQNYRRPQTGDRGPRKDGGDRRDGGDRGDRGDRGERRDRDRQDGGERRGRGDRQGGRGGNQGGGRRPPRNNYGDGGQGGGMSAAAGTSM